MTLRQRSRTAIYTGLTELIEEDAVEDLLAQFPSSEGEQPITKEFLRAELSDLGGRLRTEMADLRGELRTEMADLRGELRTEMADLRAEMHLGFRRQTQLLVALLSTFTGVVVATNLLWG